VKHLVVEQAQQEEEQVHVEDITNQQNTDIEEENQVEITRPSTGRKKTRENPVALTTPRK
jgi:hypothetical protein